MPLHCVRQRSCTVIGKYIMLYTYVHGIGEASGGLAIIANPMMSSDSTFCDLFYVLRMSDQEY